MKPKFRYSWKLREWALVINPHLRSDGLIKEYRRGRGIFFDTSAYMSGIRFPPAGMRIINNIMVPH